MKKYRFILSTILLLFSVSIRAKSTDVTGAWKGTLQVQGHQLPIIFHFAKQADGSYKATFDSPEQNAFNLPCGDVTATADSIKVDMPMIKGHYEGGVTADSIIGEWKQNGTQFDLILHKYVDKKAMVDKPQTPKPPYPYKSEDVQYKSNDGKINYGATLTLPKDGNKHAAIILISGSGQQDRDATILGHKWFLVLADHLTRNGFAVLRVDDRGIGQTTGDVLNATTADFATDVEQAISFLESRKEVDIHKIGLIGHSEGAIIAPMVAARNAKVAFVVMLAGPAIGGAIVNEEQNVASLKRQHPSDSAIRAFRVSHRSLQQAALQARTDAEFEAMVRKVISENEPGLDENSIQETIKGYNELRSPWFKFFMAYQPISDIKKLKIPVLALNGSKDTQVDPNMNLPLIEKALNNRNPLNTVKELPGLNHLFQQCTSGELDEYAKIDETINPLALETIIAWLTKATK